jgi:hypothetical protein
VSYWHLHSCSCHCDPTAVLGFLFKTSTSFDILCISTFSFLLKLELVSVIAETKTTVSVFAETKTAVSVFC